MSDIGKIQLIHDVKETFKINSSQLDDFINQIEDQNHVNNLERFFCGYKVEDHYFYLQSAMPWVKLIHALQQDQLPENSKKSYQVPDYLCVFESSSLTDYPVLVEVKSVKGDKQSIKLMKRQVTSLLEYSKLIKVPLVIAIFWEKYASWTHVPIGCFLEKEKNYKIDFITAFKSDVSVIFGDISFLISSKIYRKTTYGETEEVVAKHEKYGSVLKSSLSINGNDFIEVNTIESAVIDAFIKLKVVDENKIAEQVVVLEESSQFYIANLSNLILRHLNVFRADLNAKYSITSEIVIMKLMQRLGVATSYSVPENTCDLSDELFNSAFEGTQLFRDYEKSKNA